MSQIPGKSRLLPPYSEDSNVADKRTLLFKLVVLAVVVLLAGQIAIARYALTGFEAELDSQLYRKAHLIGESVAGQITYAIVDLGINYSALVGVDEYLGKFLEDNADIEFLALVGPAGNAMFTSGIGNTDLQQVIASAPNRDENFTTEMLGYVAGSFPIYTFEGDEIHLFVGVSSEHVRNQFTEIFFELIIVVAILCLIALEFIVFFMGAYYFEPIANIETVLSAGAKGVFSSRIAMNARDEVSRVITSMNRLLLELERHYADFVFEVQELKTIQLKEAVASRIEQVKTRLDRVYIFSGDVTLMSNYASKIRVPLFLFIFAEELSRSFLPLFVSRHVPIDSMVSHEWYVGLPITLCMLAAMAVTPLGGGLTDRYGARNVFLSGIAIAFAGFVGTFFTQAYFDLVAWRVLTGVGYGLIFTASEAWVAQHSGDRNRARNSAIFVGAVFVGVICGPPIGGIIADRIGYEATFLISAFLALISGLMVLRIFKSIGPDSNGVEHARHKKLMLGGGDLRVLLSNRRFFGLVFLASIPNKMVMAGFLFYLVPLYLNQLEHSQSAIGRMMMLYGLVTIAFTKLAARIADRRQSYEFMVIASGLISGLGFLVGLADVYVGGPTVAVLAAIICLGLGHSLAFSSQHSIVQIVAMEHRMLAGRGAILSTYRVFERSGMVIGPMLVVALSSNFGYRNAMIAIGVIMLVLTVVYAVTLRSGSRFATDPGESPGEAVREQ